MSRAGKDRSERAFVAVEALLAHLHPREDTAALVDRLRAHFVSADAMFHADPRLLEHLGVHPSDALLLSRLPELSRLMRRGQFDEHPLLSRFRDAEAYLVSCFQSLPVERAILFCLDARGKLKEQVELDQGIVDSAPFNLQKLLSEAMYIRADAVLVGHNHPGMTLAPSQEDICCTREAIRALRTVGIPLLDHVIVAGDRVISMRLNGFVSAGTWLGQNPDHPLLRGWLEGIE